jgi:hypothetical protein
MAMYLSKLQNCNALQRFKDWQKSGSTLLGNKNLGCGINSLTFLNVFSREEGEKLVKILDKRGTTFKEMMDFVMRQRNIPPQMLVAIPIHTLEEVKIFIKNIKYQLGKNACTVAKLSRYSDYYEEIPVSYKGLTSGHSVVFSVVEDKLYMIDPQIVKCSHIDSAGSLFKSLKRNLYNHVYLMYGIETSDYGGVPMVIDDENTNITHLPNHYSVPVPMEIDSENESNENAMDTSGGKRRADAKTKKTKKVNRKKTHRKKRYSNL